MSTSSSLSCQQYLLVQYLYITQQQQRVTTCFPLQHTQHNEPEMKLPTISSVRRRDRPLKFGSVPVGTNCKSKHTTTQKTVNLRSCCGLTRSPRADSLNLNHWVMFLLREQRVNVLLLRYTESNTGLPSRFWLLEADIVMIHFILNNTSSPSDSKTHRQTQTVSVPTTN